MGGWALPGAGSLAGLATLRRAMEVPVAWVVLARRTVDPGRGAGERGLDVSGWEGPARASEVGEPLSQLVGFGNLVPRTGHAAGQAHLRPGTMAARMGGRMGSRRRPAIGPSGRYRWAPLPCAPYRARLR